MWNLPLATALNKGRYIYENEYTLFVCRAHVYWEYMSQLPFGNSLEVSEAKTCSNKYNDVSFRAVGKMPMSLYARDHKRLTVADWDLFQVCWEFIIYEERRMWGFSLQAIWYTRSTKTTHYSQKF